MKYRLSTRQLLIAVTAFAVSIVLIRFGASSGNLALLLLASLILGASVGVPIQRPVLLALICAFLSGISMWTSTYYWGGGFPMCELRFNVTDEKGYPISGVTLEVVEQGSGAFSPNYPISEFGAKPLRSGVDGSIVCHQTRSGNQFGGKGRFLFWFIPVQEPPPQYQLVFQHSTYAKTTLLFASLFGGEQIASEPVPITTLKVDGEVEPIPVYTQNIVLRRRM